MSHASCPFPGEITQYIARRRLQPVLYLEPIHQCIIGRLYISETIGGRLQGKMSACSFEKALI